MIVLKIFRGVTAVALGLLITAFYSGLIIVLGPLWKSPSPLEHVPRLWLNTLYYLVYWPVLGIRPTIDDKAMVLNDKKVKLVEMNHGSFMEMFMGYRTVLNYVCAKPVIIVKRALEDNPFTDWLIVRPMSRLNLIILVDREKGETAKAAIKTFILGLGEHGRDKVFVILCDQTRPTDTKRDKQNADQKANWRRVLRPSQGGVWTLTDALYTATADQLTRVQVAHGFSRYQHTEVDAHRVVGSDYWAEISVLNDALPGSPDEYGPELTERFKRIDAELVKRQET